MFATPRSRDAAIVSLLRSPCSFLLTYRRSSARTDQAQATANLVDRTTDLTEYTSCKRFDAASTPVLRPGGLPAGAVELAPRILNALERMTAAIEQFTAASCRIADRVAPEPGDVVGTPHLAQKLGCTVVWAGEMARKGDIPKSCIVPGTGNGKPWKFFRQRIEEWLIKR